MQIHWYYENDDEDMLDEGNYLKSSIPKIDLRLIAVEDIINVL